MPRISTIQTFVCWGLFVWLTSFLYVQLGFNSSTQRRTRRTQQQQSRPNPPALEIMCDNIRVAIKESDRRCLKRLNWVHTNHEQYTCFAEHGLGSSGGSPTQCEVLAYLYKVEEICSNSVPNELKHKYEHEKEIEEKSNRVKRVKSWDELWEKLDECGFVCKWMKMRIEQHEPKWDRAFHEVFSKGNHKEANNLNKKRILLHMGSHVSLSMV